MTSFNSIPAEKQTRILNAALKEFAEKGYDIASTNAIVKAAAISKGILFHYFKNKKELYLFLYDYSLGVMGTDFLEKIDLSERDILKRWRQLAIIKIQLINKYPDIFNFILAANMEEAGEVREDLDKRNKSFIGGHLQKLMEDIDLSLFKQGIDVKKALDTLVWTMEGFTAREQEKARHNLTYEYNYEEILLELDGYLDFLKQCFYR